MGTAVCVCVGERERNQCRSSRSSRSSSSSSSSRSSSRGAEECIVQLPAYTFPMEPMPKSTWWGMRGRPAYRHALACTSPVVLAEDGRRTGWGPCFPVSQGKVGVGVGVPRAQHLDGRALRNDGQRLLCSHLYSYYTRAYCTPCWLAGDDQVVPCLVSASSQQAVMARWMAFSCACGSPFPVVGWLDGVTEVSVPVPVGMVPVPDAKTSCCCCCCCWDTHVVFPRIARARGWGYYLDLLCDAVGVGIQYYSTVGYSTYYVL